MFNVKFIGKKEIARGTEEFDFEKPTGFAYIAGQYGVWKFTDLSPTADEKGNQRDFTISSSPFEDHLSFTTRIRDTAFKNWAEKMKPGDEIQLDGPDGDLILPEDAPKKVVMIAGGIGITPLHSMINQATHDKNPIEITLFFCDKTPEDMAYFENLKSLASTNSQFQLIPVLTKPENSKTAWTGETGYLTESLLKKYLNLNLNSYLYLTAGPPAMVDAIRDTLSKAGIPVENVIGENFGGY